MTLAFSTADPNVARNRWIASLNDGTTVFQTVGKPGELSAWLQLKEYVGLKNLSISNLRLEAYGQTVVLPSHQLAYWQASRITTFVSESTYLEENAQGIGYLYGNTIHIKWISDSGRLTSEDREFNRDKELAIIYGNY